MPRRRVTLPIVRVAAIDVVDRDGFDALTPTTVAAELDVSASTLYTHIEGLDGLKYLVAVAATTNLAVAVRNAAIGTSGQAALAAMASAYRDFALDHPGQFTSTLLPPLFEDDELAAANADLLDVFGLVYRAIGLDDDESDLAARATRSAIHGFLALGHITTARTDDDAEYLYLLAALQRGLLHGYPDAGGTATAEVPIRFRS